MNGIGGDDPRATRRWFGFRDEALAAGSSEPRRLILDRNASASVVALASLPDVDAVFAANDAHAIGFMAGLREAGLLRIGPAQEQPVAVIGLGDLKMGRADRAKTINRPHPCDAIGRTAAEADAGALRSAPYRPRIRAGAARQRLISRQSINAAKTYSPDMVLFRNFDVKFS